MRKKTGAFCPLQGGNSARHRCVLLLGDLWRREDRPFSILGNEWTSSAIGLKVVRVRINRISTVIPGRTSVFCFVGLQA
ncbi:MAG: hypothetical protein CBB70_01805 [Planctomycetaceae bacterium TMED10]|nr:MAG: hypothetical protein CBB70_01805 [Planctomycetaceae bacterium TMED10]